MNVLMREMPAQKTYRENEAPLTIAHWSELKEVAKKLGHNVLIVDRIRGQMFTPAQLRLV